MPYVFPCLPYLAYIALDLNPASWAALVAQLAEHWTNNPVVTGSNPVRGSSVFFTVCLRTMPYIVLPSFAYTCTRFDHVYIYCYLHPQDRNLALHSEGIKMIVASEQPHFLAVDDDALGTGVVIYRLQVTSKV